MTTIGRFSQAQQNKQSSPSFGALVFRDVNAFEGTAKIMDRLLTKREAQEYLRQLYEIDAQTTANGTNFIAEITYPVSNFMGYVIDLEGVIASKVFSRLHADGYTPSTLTASTRIRRARELVTGKKEPKTVVTQKDISYRTAKGLKGFKVLG